MKTNRNDPCPCGSGKKYKKCCLARPAGRPGTGSMQDSMAEIKAMLAGQQFSSLEEAQAWLKRFMHTKNHAPVAEFHGLSPAQMHRFLHFPFDSPELARFADTIEPPVDAPVMKLFSLLVDGVGDKGLKPTATGNLPLKFCCDAALAYWGEEGYARHTRYGKIRSEKNFFDMHCLRLVAGLAGLVRKYRGRFIVTRKCRKRIATHGIESLYPDLFTTYVQKFNWAYRDHYEETGFIQQSFLFTLYILHKYGDQTRVHTFYEDIFIKAFPDLLLQVPDTPYFSAEQTVRSAYSRRALDKFASLFGLIDFVSTSDDILKARYEVRKLPLLDRFIAFTI